MCSYFLTHSNVKFNIDKYTITDIKLEDIAHHLANINRYGGALPFDKFYSVAQHSVELSDYLYCLTEDIELAKIALLHDASEAYLGDIVSNVKLHLKDYKRIESRLQWNIYNKFRIKREAVFLHEKMLNYYDKAMVLDETLNLMPEKIEYFRETMPGIKETGINITPLNKEDAYKLYMQRCDFWGLTKDFRIL